MLILDILKNRYIKYIQTHVPDIITLKVINLMIVN